MGLFWSEYSKIAPNPYQIWGTDEAHWVEKSQVFVKSIENNGFVYSFLNCYHIVGDRHFIWSTIVGALFYLFGENILLILLFKVIIYTLACFYMFKLSRTYFNFNASYIILIFTIIYPPLTIYHISMMREELIFFFVVVFLYINKKREGCSSSYKRMLLTMLILFTILGLRINVSICLFVIFMMGLSFKNKEKLLTLLLVSCLLFFNSNFILYLMSHFEFIVPLFNTKDTVFSLFRFIFSPLPWKIGLDNHNYYNWWWYSFTLLLMFFSIYYTKLILLSTKLTSHILFFISLYFTSYLINVYITGDSRLGIGPRQFAVIGPLFFMSCYGLLFSKIKLKSKYR